LPVIVIVIVISLEHCRVVIALLWPPYGIRQAIIFLPGGFFLLSFFFFFLWS